MFWYANKEPRRNKWNKDDKEFFVRRKAKKRSNTLCIVRFVGDAAGGKDEPACSIDFRTVPYYRALLFLAGSKHLAKEWRAQIILTSLR